MDSRARDTEGEEDTLRVFVAIAVFVVDLYEVTDEVASEEVVNESLGEAVPVDDCVSNVVTVSEGGVVRVGDSVF